ncbi:MAG: spermidine/putrescine ABC transporter substrate-binding protein [Peptoniphilaceae bacterium]|nr:spermidine/putrescine ABC transporter substrate-binding protein [Peptoniphilaceae bacterium]MDY6018526.1 spermidine/putrescine ABC transporter substrate-binding protein [Anaerococcus sp.]
MNKVYKFFLGVIFLIVVFFFGKKALSPKEINQDSNNNIYFYNWGDYIDPKILKNFEKETGYNVVYETFDSNEAMITKVQQGATSYDLVVPSDYTVEMMKEKNLLLPLDHSKIKGLENIDKRFLNPAYDRNNVYSIPYFWGTLGIVYDKTKYKKEDFASWRNLWDKKFNNEILIFDGARETLGIGLLANGYSINTTDQKVLKKVRDDLKGFMKNVKAILADEIRLYMAQGEASVGICFNGDAAIALEENKNLGYVIPKEGSNIWFDTLVIPKTAKNKEGAYALISYLLRPEVAAQNAEYICYSTPNKEAKKYLDKKSLEDPTLYPKDAIINKLEVFKHLGQKSTILYNDLFLELKISPQY